MTRLATNGRALAAAALACAVAACATTPKYLKSYEQGDIVAAEQGLDETIADKVELPVEEVRVVGQAPNCDVKNADLGLLFLDKAMLRLTQGDPKTALEWMRTVRPALDSAYVDSFGEYLGNLQSIALGDGADEYRGADYEHLLVRVMLTLADVLAQRADYRAYAFQIGEKQEEILGSELGSEAGYNPREAYTRVAIGAYLEGLVREGEYQPSEARLSYERAQQYLPDSTLIAEGLARTTEGAFAPEGQGAVHVFYLGGRGPTLDEELISPDAEIVVALAKAAVVLLEELFEDQLDLSPFFQDLVPLPKVVVHDANVPQLVVREATTGTEARAELLLDVNVVAQEQLEANKPMLLTRAVLRRALKAYAASKIDGGDSLLGEIFSFGSTVIERAETRNWATLPAQIQAARITLPEGTHTLSLGDGMETIVNVRAQNDTFVLVAQPFLARTGTVVVDSTSRDYYGAETTSAAVAP